MIGKYKVVDGHIHTFSSDEVASRIISSFNTVYDIEFINGGKGTIPDILDTMVRSGIDYSIMANFAPAKILHVNNLWSINEARSSRGLISLISFHPDMEGSFGELFEYYVENGARGIKIHPMAQAFDVNNKRMHEIYGYCSRMAFPILFHCGRVSNARLNGYADLEKLLPVIAKYPDIPFILAHMADGDADSVIRLSKEYGNIFFDTSIVISGYPAIMEVNESSWPDDASVIDIINEIGAGRILFGSDYPWGSPEHDVNRIIDLKLSDIQKKLILADNALKVFNIT